MVGFRSGLEQSGFEFSDEVIKYIIYIIQKKLVGGLVAIFYFPIYWE